MRAIQLTEELFSQGEFRRTDVVRLDAPRRIVYLRNVRRVRKQMRAAFPPMRWVEPRLTRGQQRFLAEIERAKGELLRAFGVILVPKQYAMTTSFPQDQLAQLLERRQDYSK